MKNKYIYLILGLILLTHAVLLSKLIFFPYPELFVYPYLTNNGLKPYQQVLDQHFPGLLFLPINFNNLGLINIDNARVWEIGVVFLIQILLFIIGKKLLGSPAKALIINFLYLVWQPFLEGWILWIDSFLPLLLLPAFYLLYKYKEDRANMRNFWAGLFLGLGVVFKQVLIPLVGFIAIFLFFSERKFKPLFAYLLGSFIPPFLMVLYLTGIGVLGDFWYWTVVFNLTTYTQSGRGAGPTLAHMTRAAFIFGSSFLLLIADRFKTRETILLAVFMVGVLLGLSTRFDFVHFQPALPFAVLATVYGLGKLGGLGRLGVICLYGSVAIWWTFIFYKGHLGNRVVSFDPNTVKLAGKIRNYTKANEKIFVFGASPQLYQMTNTLPAGDIFVMQFPWFLKVSENRILAGLQKDKPRIIVSDRSYTVEGLRLPQFAKELDQYIGSNYKKYDKVGTIEVSRRITP